MKNNDVDVVIRKHLQYFDQSKVMHFRIQIGWVYLQVIAYSASDHGSNFKDSHRERE